MKVYITLAVVSFALVVLAKDPEPPKATAPKADAPKDKKPEDQPPPAAPVATEPAPTEAPAPRIPLACGTDIAVVIDNSGSVTEEWEIVKDMAVKLVESIDIDSKSNRLAIIVYNYAASIMYGFDKPEPKADIIEKIKSLIQFGGSTNTWDALKTSADEFNIFGRPSVHRVICLLTDGNSENSLENLELISKKLQENGTEIYAATASDEPGLFEFRAYSVGHPERVFLKSNVTNMIPTVNGVINSYSCRNAPVAAAAVFRQPEARPNKEEVIKLPTTVAPSPPPAQKKNSKAKEEPKQG